MGSGASKSTSSAALASSWCSWCMRDVNSLNCATDDESPRPSITVCPYADCARSVRACPIPGCANLACSDSYGFVDPLEAHVYASSRKGGRRVLQQPAFNGNDGEVALLARPRRLERDDWCCLVHAGAIASFEKAGWGRLGTLESYRSIHVGATGQMGEIILVVRGVVVGAVTGVAATGIAAMTAIAGVGGPGASAASSSVAAVTAAASIAVAGANLIAATSNGGQASSAPGFGATGSWGSWVGAAVSDAIDWLLWGPGAAFGDLDPFASSEGQGIAKAGDGDTLRGIGRSRFGPEACGGNGLPLGTRASAMMAYSIFRRMPRFRERGFVLGKLPLPSSPYSTSLTLPKEHTGDSRLPTIITVDGFLQTGASPRGWERIIRSSFPNHPWVSLQWDAYPSWTLDLVAALTSTARGLSGLAVGTQRTAISTLDGTATTALSSYVEAVRAATLTSFLLADAIARFRGGEDEGAAPSVILMGHSLGCHLIRSALLLMARSNRILERREALRRATAQAGGGEKEPVVEWCSGRKATRVEMVYLLGSTCAVQIPEGHEGTEATTADMGWERASEAVEGSVVNFHAEGDDVLIWFDRLRCVMQAGVGGAGSVPSSGVEPVICRSGRVRNVRCEEVVGHGGWKEGIDVARIKDTWEAQKNVKASLMDVRMRKFEREELISI
ncbi:hypothetical protein HK101_007462 [Irineochytrium annulatum]|nr:hypothetical protein HK101_007462 [Irineochytrium annulatum]